MMSSIVENQQSIPRVLTDLNISDGNSGEVLSTNGAGVFTFVPDVSGSGDAIRVYFDANAGEALTKGVPVYISGVSGNKPIVMIADSHDPAKMPAFGLASQTVSLNANVEITTFGTLSDIKTDYPGWALGDTLYVQGGSLDNEKPSGETGLIQNLGKIQRVHTSAGSIKVGGAGRTNDTPNLNEGNIFIGDVTNCQVTASLSSEVETILDSNNYILYRSHINMPEAGGDIVEYVDWVPYATEIISITAYSDNVNTVGTLTLDVTNTGTTNSCLSSPLNMNTLVSQTVTAGALTATTTDLEFPTNTAWKISLNSSDIGMDGSGFYINVLLKRAI
jgi:hypothetical protein